MPGIPWHGPMASAGIDPKLRGMLTDLRKEVSADKDCRRRHFPDISRTNGDALPHVFRRVATNHRCWHSKAAKFGQPFALIAQYVEDEGRADDSRW